MVTSFFVGGLLFGTEPDGQYIEFGEILGYASMILALSSVFFGVKAYRDKQRNGIISFKDAFLNGLIIVVIASAIYVIGWMFYYPNFMPDFADQYQSQEITKIEASGLPQEQIEEKIHSLKTQMEYYKNPFVMAGVTFMEIFPVGLVIALICAFILKKKAGVA